MAFLFNLAKLRRCLVRANLSAVTTITATKLVSPYTHNTVPILSAIHVIPIRHNWSLFPSRKEPQMVDPKKSLKGRDEPLIDQCSDKHTALGTKTKPPFPDGTESIVFGMGCFWGAERRFWKIDNVYSTQVGYAGGYTPNPTYKEVCTGQTGHTEVVRVVYDPKQTPLNRLLQEFFNEHDPSLVVTKMKWILILILIHCGLYIAEGMKQGNDVGTQYRSAIYWTTEEQGKACKAAAEAFGKQLPKGMKVTSELKALDEFYYAEDYHQQYLQKNPNGYCGLRGSGFKLPEMNVNAAPPANDANNGGNAEQKEDL